MQTIFHRYLSPSLRHAGRLFPASVMAALAIGGVTAGVLVKPWIPTHAMGLGRLNSIVVWLLVLLVARALFRGKRQAWLVSVAVLTGLVAGLAGNRELRHLIPLTLGLLVATVVLAPLFRARSDPGALARGYPALAAGGAVLYGHAIVALLLERLGHPSEVLLDTAHVVAFVLLGFGVFEITRPVLWTPLAGETDAHRARSVVKCYATHSLAHYTLGPRLSYFWAHSGQAYLAYRLYRGVAVVLGDPVGHKDDLQDLVRRFQTHCHRQDWVLAMYQTSAVTLSYLDRSGTHVIKVGEEGIIDTQTLSLEGRIGAPVRHSIARAKRGGIRVTIWQGEAPPDPVFLGMRRISDAWLHARHSRGQMGFSMGRFPADWTPELLTAVAQDQSGMVVAFVTWTPLYRGNGWTLDNMRRAHNSVPGTMEFLIAESVAWARERGYAAMSLSLAPLADLYDNRRGITARHMPSRAMRPPNAIYGRILQRSAAYLHRRGLLLSSYNSLYAFKQKFQPDWQPRFLVISDAAAVPRVLVALAVLHGMEWRTAVRDVFLSCGGWIARRLAVFAQ